MTLGKPGWGLSQLGSQHGDLGELLGRAVAVPGQPADVSQAPQRPPCADEVAVDVGSVAGDYVAKMFLVSEREDGDVEERVALGRLGPVDDTGDLVTVDEDVVDLQVAVDEHRCPLPEGSLGELAVACDQAGGKDVVCDEPLAFAVEARCELAGAPAGPWRQRRVVQRPYCGTRRGPRGRRRGRWLAEVAECRPADGGEREHGRLAPQNLRSRDRRHGHRLDLDAG